MLGVKQEGANFRRASLVSEVYSETRPVVAAPAPPPAPAPTPKNGTSSGRPEYGGREATSVIKTGPMAKGGGESRGGKPSKPADPNKPVPYVPGMRRAVPKGKFGLIGLGKSCLIFFIGFLIYRHLNYTCRILKLKYLM